jgi:hypothetical protein
LISAPKVISLGKAFLAHGWLILRVTDFYYFITLLVVCIVLVTLADHSSYKKSLRFAACIAALTAVYIPAVPVLHPPGVNCSQYKDLVQAAQNTSGHYCYILHSISLKVCSL